MRNFSLTLPMKLDPPVPLPLKEFLVYLFKLKQRDSMTDLWPLKRKDSTTDLWPLTFVVDKQCDRPLPALPAMPSRQIAYK